ncbi:hypothetical protein GCM10025864_15330 [Luteimicrobium album]|uniref:Rhomboid family intramembrane serine protease n=1 Tax=Luteimicrobium album TaxID=1054550 RepID=A0ABQ6I1F2_9MICO|nr:hypothetical protein [Luteimicrobium album]GMA23774.1 hypothetical protein GCM10025864_15330 [Luteimicrobium album]
MATLDDDPSRTGWWRPLTAVFLQNGGVAGATWNLVTLVLVAAAACLWWGDVVTVLLFVAGALLPGLVGGVGAAAATDPRNFAGSSGATYFLAATLAAAVVLHGTAPLRERVLAALVPILGLIALVVVDDAHGLVTAEGFVVGLVVAGTVTASPLARRITRPRVLLPTAGRRSLDGEGSAAPSPGSDPADDRRGHAPSSGALRASVRRRRPRVRVLP